MPSMMPNSVGLPGFTAMPWKTISPRAAIGVEDQVALADGAAAGEDHQVFGERGVERAVEIVERVGRRRVGHRHRAVLRDDRGRA